MTVEARVLCDRLLALDLDGTLLRSDGTIDPRDLTAIQRARARGCAVTLATGRITATTVPVARALGLEVPLVCADGRIVAHAESGAVIELFAVPSRIAALAILRDHALAPLHITPTHIVHEPGETEHLAWLGPTAEIVVCARVDHVDPHDTVMMLGLGTREAAMRASEAIGDALRGVVAVDVYPLADGPHAVRVWAPGHDKRSALERVVAGLGLAATNVCTVGDWHNDVGMLRWAGRSFAMAGAPLDVLAAASDRLVARAGQGGGVAEAIERWLG
jgi:hydroxymethylpyrimidine pyrophosphatase-like HAD family hydrolase